jgi:Cu2+-exporting ATPase
VVACPCALGLSVPLAVSVALLRAARAGIFVKNPDALERLRHVETVLLDKTGTLTEGRATVARWLGEDGVLQFARALEAESSHAVARAFRHSFGSSMRVVRRVEDVAEVAGLGIAGRIDGHEVRVGNRTHVMAAGATVPAEFAAAAEAMVIEGLSPVWVALDGRVAGVAGIGDALRPDARTTVAALRARGVDVRILSGDHPEVVARVGAELGLPGEAALGGLTPERKRDVVEGLAARPDRTGAVVMVGDGVNDAAALALADVGIAVHGGTGATIVAADIVLTRQGVAPVLDILEGARRLRGVIRRNLGFSLAYNAGASALAVAGLVSPLLAAVLMPVSSLTVVLSSALSRTFAAAGGTRRGGPPRGAQAGA